jgi:hypothetical protein
METTATLVPKEYDEQMDWAISRFAFKPRDTWLLHSVGVNIGPQD